MKYFFKLLPIICVVFCLFSFMPVLADDDHGLGAAAGRAFGSDIPFESATPSGMIGQVIGIALSFLGILFFLLIIYGGFTWMTARGNDQEVEKAINILRQAIIGLVIVAGAYLLTRFIGESLLSTTTQL